MSGERWAAVDGHLADLLVPADPALEAALAESAAAGLPAHEVSPLQGRLLGLLARAVGARSVLELGTLGGYSTIWLGRALGPDGRVVSLEADPAYAEVARANLERAGLGELVEIRVGPASESLAALAAERAGPFDLVFIDADKQRSAEYLGAVLGLVRPGSVIVADNVIRAGAVADADDPDPRVAGTRRFLELAAADSRLEATAIQTVGAKGWDGFALALVTGGEGGAGAV